MIFDCEADESCARTNYGHSLRSLILLGIHGLIHLFLFVAMVLRGLELEHPILFVVSPLMVLRYLISVMVIFLLPMLSLTALPPEHGLKHTPIVV